MMLIGALISLALAAILAIGAYLAGHFRGWWARRRSTAALKALLEPHIKVYRPAGDGPFPGVLLLHGCGGVKTIQAEYAKAAADAGVLAVVLDSLTPRGITYRKALGTVCKGRRLIGAERAGDIIAGLELMRGMADVDAARMAVAGWSHGSWSIMDLLATRLPEERPHGLKDAPDDVWAGVRGAYLIYPYCGFPSLTRERGWARGDIRARMLLVENDTLADSKLARRAAEKARASGASVEIDLWKDVTHAFDETPHEPDSKLVYDADAAARSHARFAEWLSATLTSQARRE